MDTSKRVAMRLNAVVALLMAMVLVVGLQPQAQALAPASIEPQATAELVTVALTVVDESDSDNPNVVYNGKVSGLTTNDTVADLLAAAGFESVESKDDWKQWDQYWNGGGSNYPSPYFLGKEYDSVSGMYWETTFNGDSSSEYSKAYLTAPLVSSGHYQYIYKGWGAPFSYTSQVPDPLTTEVSKKGELLNNFTARFGKGGSDGSLTKMTYGAALALGYLGKGGRVDVEALKENADKETSAGALAKYVLAMNAAGVDGATLESYVKKMESLEAEGEGFYSLVLILAAHDQTGIAPVKGDEGGRFTEQELVAAISNSQVASGEKKGLFALVTDYYSDPANPTLTDAYANAQSTAEAIFALTPHRGETEAYPVLPSVLEAAVSAAKGQINSSGVVLPDAWSQAKIDHNAMGELLDAFATHDPASCSESIASLSAALVDAADGSLSGYTNDNGVSDETYASADAFRGLAAAWRVASDRVSLDNEKDARADVADASVAIARSQVYSGSAISPALSVTFGEKTLVEGADYEVSWTDNMHVGTAKGIITGKGAFRGTKEVSFAIAPKEMSELSAPELSDSYTGKAVNPVPVFSFNGMSLVSGVDFTFGYLNSKMMAVSAAEVKAAGIYYVRVIGQGNYMGAKDVKLTISKAAISKAKVKKISKRKYTGKAIKPKPKVTFNGQALKKGVDYKLSYSKNKKVGTAKIKITGKGNFEGSKTVKFKIVKANKALKK